MAKKSVDINNPMYRLPLELGWRREQVFKKMTRISDSVVYYYSPSNQKLRSLAEIKKLLDSNDYSPLTIKHFTFVKQTIGMNKNKEFVTDAVGIKQSTPRVEFFFKSKKEKTLPLQQFCDHELLENQNKSSLNNIQINLNIEETSISDQLKTIDMPSTISKGISKDLQIFGSRFISKVTSSTQTDVIKISETNNKRRKINYHKETPTLPANSEYIVMESMIHVFKHLKTHELLTASRVCTSWNFIAMKSMFWQNVSLNYSMVYDWDKCIDTIEKKSSVSLDIRCMSIPIKFDEYVKFWSHFNMAIKRAKRLKVIELCKCPPSVVENILSTLPQLEILTVTSIQNSNLVQDTMDVSFLNLNHLDQMKNLTVLRLHGLSGIQFTIPSFINLRNLKTLSLTSVKKFPINIYSFLETVTLDLDTLEIGDCELLSEKFVISLRRFINLRYLRLENGFNNFAPEVFDVIKSFNKLKILELINIKVTELVKNELKNCNCINSLLIIPDYKNKVAVTNTYVIECLINLSKTLTHVIWGITVELLQMIETFISENEKILGKGENESSDSYSKVPILNKLHLMTQLSEELPETTETDDRDDYISFDLVPFVKLKTMLEEKLINVKTKIIKVPFLETTEVYLAKYFNDI